MQESKRIINQNSREWLLVGRQDNVWGGTQKGPRRFQPGSISSALFLQLDWREMDPGPDLTELAA